MPFTRSALPLSVGLLSSGHTDTYMVRLEMRDILIAAVLHSTVRMVNGSTEVAATGTGNSLFQGLYGVLGFQRGRQDIAQYHAGVRVRNQMQITELILCGVDVRYIAYPQLVNIGNNEAFGEVGILKVHMI